MMKMMTMMMVVMMIMMIMTIMVMMMMMVMMILMMMMVMMMMMILESQASKFWHHMRAEFGVTSETLPIWQASRLPQLVMKLIFHPGLVI